MDRMLKQEMTQAITETKSMNTVERVDLMFMMFGFV